MSPIQKTSFKLSPIDQLAIVVKDLDKAVEFYTTKLGWGPFNIIEVDSKGSIYRGKPTGCRLKIAFGRSGLIEIEIFQVLEGNSPHVEFLRTKGEGLHHVRCKVDDLDEALAEWAKEGIEPVWVNRDPIASVAYMDTDKSGGVMVELIQWHLPDEWTKLKKGKS
ncbi:MAG: VOC family protein [Dehalococcoidia bacterium]